MSKVEKIGENLNSFIGKKIFNQEEFSTKSNLFANEEKFGMRQQNQQNQQTTQQEPLYTTTW